MSNVTFKTSNSSKPAPLFWRKFEDGMLMILIPAIVAILMGWGFADETHANKIILLINVGLVALIKFIGKMLANGEEYAPAKEEVAETFDGPGSNPGGTPPSGPPPGGGK